MPSVVTAQGRGLRTLVPANGMACACGSAMVALEPLSETEAELHCFDCQATQLVTAKQVVDALVSWLGRKRAFPA